MAFVQEDNIEPQDKRYKVVGTQAVDGHLPGEEFTATLLPQREALLVEYGHLEVLEAAVNEGEQKESGVTPVESEQSGTTPTTESEAE